MIREFESNDLERVMTLWLEANIQAHSFIDPQYWQSMYETVKTMLPEATIYVYEQNRDIIGFIGTFDTDIAGIFVDQKERSQGIGKALLDFLKEQKTSLNLDVYEKNSSALRFYQREGFIEAKRTHDSQTNELELHLTWHK